MKHKLKALMLAIFSVFFVFGVKAQADTISIVSDTAYSHSNLKIQTKLIKGLMLISSKKSLNARDGTTNKLTLVLMLQ